MKENTKINDWTNSIDKAMSASADKSKRLSYLLKLSSKPKRSRVCVNLRKLSRYANDNDKIIVPGKVLGSGGMAKKITIAAMDFSSDAVKKLKSSNCNIVGVESLLNDKTARIII